MQSSNSLRLFCATTLLCALLPLSGCSGQRAANVPAPAVDAPRAAGPLQKVVLAGGCFWGVQAVFEHLHGVRRAVSGYAGGDAATANYGLVSTGDTGHAESVEITFDPQQVTLGQILQVFFAVAHDPTLVDRQGPDIGSQYRSVIFYADDGQRQLASAYISQLDQAKVFDRPIATRVDRLTDFYPAEDYHQDFLLRNPDNPYIVANDLPKLRVFQRLLPASYVETPATVGDRATTAPGAPGS